MLLPGLASSVIKCHLNPLIPMSPLNTEYPSLLTVNHSSISYDVDARFRKSLRPGGWSFSGSVVPLKTREMWRRPSWQGKARGKRGSIELLFRFVSIASVNMTLQILRRERFVHHSHIQSTGPLKASTAPSTMPLPLNHQGGYPSPVH